MPKNGFIKPEELEYIKDNCLIKTDKELANHLNKDIRTIKAWRKKLGIEKSGSGKVQKMNIGQSMTGNSTDIIINKKLTEEQRKSFFQTQLRNSLFYSNLKEQFTSDEIEFYLEEWGALCVQFEDIVASEKRQIDELIKAEIMANRMLRNIKIAEDQIEATVKEIEELRKNSDISNNEVLQERDIQLMTMLRTMHGQSQGMANDYQKNVELRNKLLDELNARRKDRIDQIKKGNTTFLGLIQAFRDKETRESQGRHMELMRLAKQKKLSEWRKPTIFPDGSKDCVLMDPDSELPKKNIVMMEDMKSKFIDEFSKEKGKNILVIDDENRRQQFFSEVFKENRIDFASNPDKAIDKVTSDYYHLICLDYDLGMNRKGTDFARFIIDNNLCENTKILIHSMNKDGSEKIKNLLITKRDIEKFPFEEIYKNFGDKSNA
jgi:CheY-like chemotaxis protein